MTPLRIFVRRGALRRFHRLTRDAKGLPVSIEWDRRTGDRSTDPPKTAAAIESPATDRRSDPPLTWTAGEFVVVNDPPDEA
jgi:hypothetical protein